MAANLRDLRRKIKSTAGTRKLTQAMQMVAASKMQKATSQAQKSRDYSRLAWEIIKNVGAKTDVSYHPLLTKREKKTIGIILVSSNKGLCGGLNAQVFRLLNNFIKEKKEKGFSIKIITVGNKGKNFASRFYKEMLIADFAASDRLVEFTDATAISKLVIDGYQNNEFDRVFIFYNHFVSVIKQDAKSRQILPIPDMEEVEEYQVGRSETRDLRKENSNNQQISNSNLKLKSQNSLEYKFEPDVKSILDTMIPKIIQTQIYQILLEANASEHSARMVAMKNATDSAGDIIDDLTLTYNSLRQASITQEITEISAGAEALKS